MQHPVGYTIGPDGEILLSSFWALLTNPWMIWQYIHTMVGAVITACFVVAAVGAYYLLNGRFEECARVFLRIAVVVGLPATILMAFPTGDIQSKMVAKHQPAAFAAMEGLFETKEGAPFPIFGLPDRSEKKLNSRIEFSRLLSFMLHGRFDAEVTGLDAFPEEEWPDNIPLLFFSHQAMVMMGILFILVMMLSTWLLFKGRLFESKPVLWILMLIFPLPYIANTAGWTTAELGRQPYLIYGLMRTEEGFSHTVTSGSTIFTLIGFIALYILLSILFLFFVSREIRHGPVDNTGMIGIANTPDSKLTAEQE
jgi:cytochrome d ubiquinol oxidase subunit I